MSPAPTVEIEEYMNVETLECPVEVFIETYLPRHHLYEDTYKAMYDAGTASAEEYFEGSLPFTKEAEIASSLQVVVDAIVQAWKYSGGEGRCLRYSVMPNQTFITSFQRGNFKIDASLDLNQEEEFKAIYSTNVVVAMDFELHRHDDTVCRGHQQLISETVHIMNNDVRRMFMFGITIEETRVTLWYFSRSHSMKTQSFDLTEDSETLVEVLISLMFAEDKDLGFDPNIALTSHHTKCQYIYTVNSETGPRRFMTTHSISENRALSVAGRMTRVFRVLELEGQTNEPKEGAKSMVLKDVWLDEGSRTEIQIQQALFADIEKFAKNPEWRKDPSLSGFSNAKHEEILRAFGEVLEGDRYKDLFLVIRDGSTGEPLKPLPSSAWPPQSKAFFSAAETPHLDVAYASTQRLAGPQSNAARDRQLRPADQVAEAPLQNYTSKRRSFLIFDDECTRLHCLPTVGDVLTVLRQCIIALRLMFCAGWVHRDISCNNIMAVQDPQTKQWNLKLADLEYSKKYGVNVAASDTKTGTPFFMSCEILRHRYFGLTKETDGDDEDESDDENDDENDEGGDRPHDDSCQKPLLHNYLHDLEATFWTGLWIITNRVEHEESETYARSIFQDTLTLTLPPSRLDAFELPIGAALHDCLLPKLQRLAPIFETVRKHLYSCAIKLGKKEAWTIPEGHQQYSALHARFAVLFNRLANPKAAWAAVPLQLAASSSLRFVTDVVVEKAAQPLCMAQDPEGKYSPEAEVEEEDEEEVKGDKMNVRMKRKRKAKEEKEEGEGEEGYLRHMQGLPSFTLPVH